MSTSGLNNLNQDRIEHDEDKPLTINGTDHKTSFSLPFPQKSMIKGNMS